MLSPRTACCVQDVEPGLPAVCTKPACTSLLLHVPASALIPGGEYLPNCPAWSSSYSCLNLSCSNPQKVVGVNKPSSHSIAFWDLYLVCLHAVGSLVVGTLHAVGIPRSPCPVCLICFSFGHWWLEHCTTVSVPYCCSLCFVTNPYWYGICPRS